ncbi:4-(cytidine 5'-diphospho)-2-C-methyl-D-erythritol kinase [Azoarcus sp. L1K30]|uniref:4-(cytidine 5'-diphospho)-2-C-methyl-D-erythritol kinase n=1 Tax=Azoarcus sp. L1K30 TaxID=2820277 RepID=UPI001B81504A|nr:4-(cytidine 5'-diphospho)-2-C-methyl-D-erythritol kinase [Azoarcus sp. L1K30]MBR0568263.1 4-(cytidine 5'-diphospho)-2-C-methyl-D-erythritol kinase [Azoarcus sp. L1K30]
MDAPALNHPLPGSPRQLQGCLAPAKLNLFLHVTGRREDGYHMLQTAFRMLDWGDTLDFRVRDDGRIRRLSVLPGVAEEDDIVIRAARLLQRESGCSAGADITLHKVLPMGGGLGGGSSDAATTLIALNHLWETGLDRRALQALGLRLGADVPFFIFGRDAFAEGVGELFQPLTLDDVVYVVISPGVSISTAEIFSSKDLTRNTVPIKIADFTASSARNDLQAVACNRYPEVAEAINWLAQFAPARMTGSGACVFAAIDSGALAQRIVEQCPTRWKAWKASSLARHPLDCLVV